MDCQGYTSHIGWSIDVFTFSNGSYGNAIQAMRLQVLFGRGENAIWSHMKTFIFIFWILHLVNSVHLKSIHPQKRRQTLTPISPDISSLIPVPSQAKIFESAVFKKLYPQTKCMIPPQQHGFVQGRSTQTNLLRNDSSQTRVLMNAILRRSTSYICTQIFRRYLIKLATKDFSVS